MTYRSRNRRSAGTRTPRFHRKPPTRCATGECGIKEAAHRFFDEHIGFATTETERADEQLYAERFRDFVLMIAADLKRNPRWFSTYRKLGVLHAEKMNNSAYRRSHETKHDYVERIRQELKSIGVID